MDKIIEIIYNSETENWQLKTEDLFTKKDNHFTIFLNFLSDKDIFVDVTGYTIFFTVKEDLEDTDGVSASTALIEKDITSLSDPVNGEAKIELTNIDLNFSGNYIYSIKLKTDDDKLYTVCEGLFYVSEDVTSRNS